MELETLQLVQNKLDWIINIFEHHRGFLDYAIIIFVVLRFHLKTQSDNRLKIKYLEALLGKKHEKIKEQHRLEEISKKTFIIKRGLK